MFDEFEVDVKFLFLSIYSINSITYYMFFHEKKLLCFIFLYYTFNLYI